MNRLLKFALTPLLVLLTTSQLFAATGDVRWSFPTSGEILSSPAIGSDGTVYVGSNAGYIYAINPTGTQKWAFPLGPEVTSSPSIGADGTIYIGTGDRSMGSSNAGKLYAINSNGTQKWVQTIDNVSVYTAPAIGADGSVYVGTFQNGFKALNSDGSTRWTASMLSSIKTMAAIGGDGTVYLVDGMTRLRAFNPQTGAVLWTYGTGASPGTSMPFEASPVIGADGTIYISSSQKFFAINPDGTKKWEFFQDSVSSPILGADGTIYFGDYGGVRALNPDGSSKWYYAVSGQYFRSTPAVGSDGTIYAGCDNGTLYALNPDGTLNWSRALGGQLQSSPAIASDGTVYIGSSNGGLYAVEVPTGGLAASDWPMFGRNTSHTARADALPVYDVTPVAGANGSMTPATTQTVTQGHTTSFTVTAANGYEIGSVTGCSGSLVGSTYTTGAITADCSVSASFVPKTWTVTPSAGVNGSITPATAQTVNEGQTTSFTLTPDAAYVIGTVTGCGGSLVGSTYTTGAISSDCTVTASFAQDLTAPTTSASPSGRSFASFISVTLTADEAATIYYTTDGSTPTTGSVVYSSAINISSDTTLKFFAVDVAGNQESVKTESYIQDTVAPASTAVPAGGTYTSNQLVTLTCDDSTGSGCAAIYYTTNGSTPTTGSAVYTGAISISSDTTLKFFAADVLGNKEAVQTESYIIDAAAPVTTASPAGGYYASTQTVTLTCDDGSGTGCDAIYYTTDGSTPTTASNVYSAVINISADSTLKFFATDLAGNQEVVQTESYVFDTVDPITMASPVGGTYLGTRSVSLACDDGTGSGCDKVYYTLDGSAPTTTSSIYSAPINISADTTLKFFATDVAGNQEIVQTESYVIIVDSAAPTTTATPSGGIYNSVQSVSLTCDDGSGSCDKTYYTTDGSTPTTASSVYSGLISLATNTVLKFFSTDLSGNQEAVQTESYIIDTTDPVTTASPAGGIYNSVQLVSLSCDDGTGTGCATIYYTTNGSAPTTASSVFTSDITIAENTTVAVKYFATDLAGNAEAVKTANYTVDTIPPVVSVSAPAGSLINKHNPLFSVNLSETATVATYLNSQLVGKLSGNELITTGDADLKLLEGPNTIRVEATDLAGNFGFTEVQVAVDSLIAAPFIDPLPASWTETSYTLTGRAEQDSTVTVFAPGASVGSVVRDVSDATIWNCTLSNLTTGALAISATASDAAGNVSDATTATLNVDVDILSPVAVTVSDTLLGGTVDLDWSGYAEAANSFALYLAKEPFRDVTAMTPFRSYNGATTQTRINGLTTEYSWYFAVVAVNAEENFDPQVSPASLIPVRQGVFGQVTSVDSGEPLQGLEVTVSGQSPVLSDSDGRFSVAGLAAGPYTLQVGESGGDQRFVGTTTGIEVNAGQMTEQNVALVTNAALAPSVPQGLSAVAGDGEVELSWQAVADADLAGYRVYRDGSATALTSYLITGTRFVDGNLLNGTSYDYNVRAVNTADQESADSGVASATPVAALPQPPTGLEATLNLNCDGSGEPTVTLSWVKSPTATGYSVYWNSGDALDYTNFETVNGVDTVTWTSSVLTPGQGYAFGVRAFNGSGEELNDSVALSVEVDTGGRAQVTAPSPGLRVSGDALVILAESTECAAIGEVLFQYRKFGDAQWLEIPSAKASNPNPATDPPYLVYWDVTGTEFTGSANYELRALAYDLAGSADPAPPVTTVVIDNDAPAFVASDSGETLLSVQQALDSNRDNMVVLVGNCALGTVKISLRAGSLESDTTLLAEIPSEEEMADLASESSLGILLRLSLLSGQSDFGGQSVEISMTYPDVDDDGIVDTLGIAAADLTLGYYNKALGVWEELELVNIDPAAKTVSGQTSHFSLFALLGKSGLAPLEAPGKLFLPSSSDSGAYQLSWFQVLTAEIYELQEASDPGFTQNVKTLYSGPEAYYDVTDKAVGTYYYRVRSARSGALPSPWRSGQNAITVTTVTACEAPRKLYLPASSETGSFQISWSHSATEGATYELEVNDGSGYEPLYKGAAEYYDVEGFPGGTFSFRVRAHKEGLDSSAYVTSSVDVTVFCGSPKKIYLPSSNSSGSLQISWSRVSIPGVSYVLEDSVDGGAFKEVYSGTNHYADLTGLQDGIHVYRVKAVAPGYQDSTPRTSKPCVVTLQCDAPRKIYLPSSSTGRFQISWFRSFVAGVTYVLEVSQDGGAYGTLYTGPDNYVNVGGLSAGSYRYRVKAMKANYNDSFWRLSGAVTVN